MATGRPLHGGKAPASMQSRKRLRTSGRRASRSRLGRRLTRGPLFRRRRPERRKARRRTMLRPPHLPLRRRSRWSMQSVRPRRATRRPAASFLKRSPARWLRRIRPTREALHRELLSLHPWQARSRAHRRHWRRTPGPTRRPPRLPVKRLHRKAPRRLRACRNRRRQSRALQRQAPNSRKPHPRPRRTSPRAQPMQNVQRARRPVR